jgi:hypothetical protein
MQLRPTARPSLPSRCVHTLRARLRSHAPCAAARLLIMHATLSWLHGGPTVDRLSTLCLQASWMERLAAEVAARRLRQRDLPPSDSEEDIDEDHPVAAQRGVEPGADTDSAAVDAGAEGTGLALSGCATAPPDEGSVLSEEAARTRACGIDS